MEEKNQDRGNVTAFDVQDAIRILQIQNTLLEGRFEIIGEALIKLSTGLKAIQQMMSPILPISDDQKSVRSADQNADMGDIFPNNEEDEVNLSFRDNEAAVQSIRSKNIGLRQKSDKSSKVEKSERRELSMIRNLDRLTSGQDDNIRVYKSTPSYEHIKLTSDNISIGY